MFFVAFYVLICLANLGLLQPIPILIVCRNANTFTASISQDSSCIAGDGNPFFHETGRHGRCQPQAYREFISDRAARRRLCVLEKIVSEQERKKLRKR